MNFLTFAVKSIVYSTGILGAGYVCYTTLVPSESYLPSNIAIIKISEMKKKLGLSDEQFNAKATKNTELQRFIEYNAQSDRPIWDVRAYVHIL
ncbi:hypothetical protein HK096_000774 [Nowakowskiella sp. JEL0078]|nr:hypothetical protein HK096_000774 [Nowakowskiella sp. JEL0078]